jgi:hypothetical protein
MLQGDFLDNVLEELRKLLYHDSDMPILTIWSDALGNIEKAADTPENDDKLEGGGNEHILPSSSRTPSQDDPIDDEDIEAGIVSDPNSVLADVKMATTVREALFFS